MKNKLFVLFSIVIALHSSAQTFEYSYDNAGNRVQREVIMLMNLKSADDSGHFDCAQCPDSTALPALSTSWLSDLQIVIYPNPTAGQLRMDISGLPLGASGSIRVWDTRGTEIMELSPPAAVNIIDLSTQPAGVYILRLEMGGMSREWKVVRE